MFLMAKSYVQNVLGIRKRIWRRCRHAAAARTTMRNVLFNFEIGEWHGFLISQPNFLRRWEHALNFRRWVFFWVARAWNKYGKGAICLFGKTCWEPDPFHLLSSLARLRKQELSFFPEEKRYKWFRKTAPILLKMWKRTSTQFWVRKMG